jgi:hypothetical protein
VHAGGIATRTSLPIALRAASGSKIAGGAVVHALAFVLQPRIDPITFAIESSASVGVLKQALINPKTIHVLCCMLKLRFFELFGL